MTHRPVSELLTAIVLGIVQGLTEFLPVSSSGHIELAKALLGDDAVGEESLLMTVVLHFATALATLYVFRADVLAILRGVFAGRREDLRFAGYILVSMVPAALVGLTFETELDALFAQRIALVGCMLIVTGLLLFLADRARATARPVGLVSALVIGLAQAVAILPGISRSGATISTSVLLGIDRERAARFSFLMVVPLIFGKVSKDLLDGELGGTTFDASYFGAGFVAAFLTGVFACRLMIRLVRASKLRYFSYYCFAVAALALAWSYLQ